MHVDALEKSKLYKNNCIFRMKNKDILKVAEKERGPPLGFSSGKCSGGTFLAE